MHHEAIDTFLKALAQALAPYMVESVVDHLAKNGMLTTEIDTRIQDKIEDLDVEEKISDWMSNSFDIEDYIDVTDKVDDYLSDRLTSMVRDEVRDLSFSVRVD